MRQTKTTQSSGWLTPPRLKRAELLDLGEGAITDVAANLAEMSVINRFLGGERALTSHLYPRLARLNRPAWLVDIGSGSAVLPHRILHWSHAQGIDLQVVAVDWSARVLSCAAHQTPPDPAFHFLQADALELSFPFDGVDYLVSTLFLHHLAPGEMVRMLRSAYHWARCGLVMSDLVRGWLPFLAFKLVQPVFARNYLTRHDGALSIRRAYTPQELLSLAQQAGLRGARVHTHFPWRMTLVVDK